MSSIPVIVGGAAKDSIPSVIIGGVEKKIYDAYVIVGGAAKLIYKSAVPTTYYADYTYKEPNASGTLEVTNASTASDLIICGYASGGSTSCSGYVGIEFKIQDTGIYSNATVMKISGTGTMRCTTNVEVTEVGAYIRVYNSSGVRFGDFPGATLSQDVIYPEATTNLTLNATLSTGSISEPPIYTVTIYIKIDADSGTAGSATLTIPWSAFQWVDDQGLDYQP